MKYRAEIDGLRALAVVPVILFHAGFDFFNGGFIGVDVFFVISGYLITTILIDDIEKDRYSIVRFYERRARRIMPALFVMMMVCLPFAWLWMLPAQLKSFSASAFATVTFLSNFYFMAKIDYFASSSDLQPLLHTWTLAIEEQYYLFFPPLLYWFMRRSFNAAFWAISLLCILSFCFSEWGWRNYPEHSFFFSFSRFWELFIGSLVAFTLKKYRVIGNNWFASLGLLAILFSIVTYNDTLPFPSGYTLTPVLGTALLILYASRDTYVGRLLSIRPLVGIGLISYSAYLWHQPLFAFARMRSFDTLTPLAMLGFSVVSLVIAFISWKYIESPFRKPSISTRQIFSASGAVILLMGSIGIAGYSQEGFETRLASTFERLKSISTVEQSYCHNEGKKTPEQLLNDEFCVLGKGAVSYAIIGDSHAGALFDYADHYLAQKQITSIAVSGGYCAPLLNGFTYRKNCPALMNAAFDKVIAAPNIENVILFAEWANYTKGYRDDNVPKLLFDNEGHAATPQDNSTIFQRSFAKTMDALLQAGKHVIIVNPVPEFEQNAYRHVAQKILVGDASSVDDASKTLPPISIETYKERNKEVFEVFSGYQDKVTFVDVVPLFCDQYDCFQYDASSGLLYSDSNHVNELGAEKILPTIFSNTLSP